MPAGRLATNELLGAPVQIKAPVGAPVENEAPGRIAATEQIKGPAGAGTKSDKRGCSSDGDAIGLDTMRLAFAGGGPVVVGARRAGLVHGRPRRRFRPFAGGRVVSRSRLRGVLDRRWLRNVRFASPPGHLGRDRVADAVCSLGPAHCPDARPASWFSRVRGVDFGLLSLPTGGRNVPRLVAIFIAGQAASRA